MKLEKSNRKADHENSIVHKFDPLKLKNQPLKTLILSENNIDKK